MGDPRQDFMKWSQNAWKGADQARLDQEDEIAQEERRIDAISDHRTKYREATVFLGKYGRLPRTGISNGRADQANNFDNGRRFRLDSLARLEVQDMSMTTSQGFLVADAYPTKAGIFLYVDEATGKTRRELRHPDEVFKQESMDSLKMVPVTYHHPEQMVTTDNVKDFQIGVTGENIRRSGDFVACKVQITDKSVIGLIKAGQISTQLSCGYKADIIPQSGVWRGQEYDTMQKNIVYNHLSIVPQGRAGADARLYL